VYPKYGFKMQSYHYAEILSELIDKEILRTSSLSPLDGDGSDEKLQVSYHDPCYLGRYHGIYEQPRKILEGLHNTTLVEMKDSKDNALCCGGGGGQLWIESFGERPSHKRILQAAETGASVMATSCPYCVQNFEDAAKTKGVTNVKVMDVSELVANSLQSKKG
jgi:Fe-S oxidoreductase